MKGAAGSKVAAPGNQLLRRALLAVTPAAQAPDQHFMRQPQELSKAPDKVLVRPTVQHLQSRVKAAVSPEGVTASLGGQSGFVIEFGGKGSEVSVSKLATPEEVRKKNDEVQRAGIERAAAEGKVKAPPMMVKGFFDFDWVEDAWDDVKKAAQAVADAAEKLYEEAQAIVVEIGDQVSLFVHQLGEIVTVVVDSVEKAVAAVVGFLEKIYVLLKEFVEFLMMLFDWGAILKAHDVMRDVLRRGALAVADLFDPRNLGNLGAQLKAFILGQEPDPGKPKQSESLDTSNLITEDAQNIGGQCNTSQTKTMQKRAEVAAPATEYPPGAPPVAPKSGPDGEKGSKLIGDVLALLADVDGLLSGNPLAALPLIADLPNTIKDFFPFDPAELEDVLGGALGGIDNWAEEKGPAWMVVDAFWGMLDADLDIPFISMLYKWITGRSLTIASLLCLLTGLAAHIAHAFASLLLTGSARQFHEDAGGLADQTENQLRTLKQPRQSQNPAPKPTMRAAAKSVTLASGADVGEASPPSMAATAGEAGPDDPNKGDKGAAIALTVCYAVFGAGRLLTHRLVMIEQEEHRASGDTLWGDKEARECTAKLFGGDALLGLTTVAFLTGFRVASAKSREPQDMAATAVSGLVAAVPPILQLITAYNIYSDGTEGAPGTIGQQVAKLRRAVGGNPKKTIVVGGLAVLSFIAYTIAQGVRSGGDAQGIVGNIGTTVGIGASTYQFYISGADEIFSNNVAHMQEDAGRPGRPPADMDKVEFAIIVDAVGWVLQIAGMSIRAKELDG